MTRRAAGAAMTAGFAAGLGWASKRGLAGAVPALVLLAIGTGTASAQTAPTPDPVPSPTAPAPAIRALPGKAPDRIRGLDEFSLPPSRPGPAATIPAPALPTPVIPAPARPVPAVPVPVAPVRTAPVPPASTPRATPTPVAPPSPEPRSSPVAAPSPSPAPAARQPVAAPTPAAPRGPVPRQAPVAAPSGTGPSPWWLLSLPAIALAVVAWWRRRRVSGPEPVDHLAEPPTPAAPPAPRARIEIELLPRRGGLTLISLVFEGEVMVRNLGDARAAAVTVEASLIPARSGQDEELGALFARPIGRPATPPFALAPGEERRVRLVAAMPLAGTEPLTAGGRAMIVPVLAANVRYAADGGGEGAGEGQTAAAWIIGVARPGTGKLAPFWLDAPGLSDALAARPHALALEI